MVDNRFAELVSGPTARLMTQLRMDLSRMTSAVAALDPGLVVMASDQHRYGVLACWAAEAARVPSLVLQHGLPIDDVGYTPLRADHVAVFGESSRRYFLSKGASVDAVHVVGFPRVSWALNTRRGVERNALLVPLQPQDDESQRALLEIAAEHARGGSSSVVLRVHPGDSAARAQSREALLHRLGWPHDLPVQVDLAVDPTAALSMARAVVTYESTFALDALAAGLPVILVEQSRSSALTEGEFATISDSQDLERLLNHPETLHRASRGIIAHTGPAAITEVQALLDRLVSAGG